MPAVKFNKKNLSSWFIALVANFVLILAGTSPATSGSFVELTEQDRTYMKYVPNNLDGQKVPLLVMLHGCTQTPKQFARDTKMNELADEKKFIVIYPRQTEDAQRYRCWNFWDDYNITRGSGEAKLIASMVRSTINEHSISDQQIYLAGLSGGGAMAAHLAASYPDLYAAVGIHSGLEFGAANSALDAVVALEQGGPDPEKTSREAYENMGRFADVVPTIVIQGTDDEIVNPINGRQAVKQAIRTIDLVGDGKIDGYIDYRPDSIDTGSTPGHQFTRREYRLENGKLAVVEYRINDMGHAWSGGHQDGHYVNPDGPSASRIIWKFLTRHTQSTVDGNVLENIDPDITVNKSLVLDGETVAFNATGENSNRLRYRWDFDDGSSASGPSVQHSFTEPGNYEVTLQVTGPNDINDSTTQLIRVYASED